MSRPNGDSPPRMRGATASVAGSRGIVPKPTAGQHTYMLLGDGTWGAQPIAGLPSQTSNSGKLLTTDGTNAAWTTTGVLTSLTSPAATALVLATGSFGTALTVASGTGNVGIGTTGPLSRLDVQISGATSGQSTDVLTLGAYQTGTANANGTGILFNTLKNGGGAAGAARIYTNLTDGTVNGERDNLIFQTMRAGTLTDAVTIQSSGNVGIGTTSPSTKLDVNGALTVSTGAAVGGATAGAGGLAFPATAVAVADANTLDDYEEGTWTPSIGGNATYTTQVGSYTKIGRQITLWFDLTIITLGTGSTTKITGAPFPPVINTNYHTGTVYWGNIATNQIALGIYIQQYTGDIYFIGANASAASITNQVAVIGSGATFRGTLTYYV